MEIKDDMIELTDDEGNSCVYINTGNTDLSSTSKDTRTGHQKAFELKKRILQNEALRKEVVDLADLWDGKESSRYGNSLQNMLDRLDVHDTPDFYKQENINKLIDELEEERAKKKLRKHDT